MCFPTYINDWLPKDHPVHFISEVVERLEHVSVDGTKIKANASKHSAMSYAYMQKEEGRLREEIEKILNRMEEIDRAEDKIYGDRVPHRLPEELATKEKRLKAIEEAKKRLEERAREKVLKEQEKRKQKAQKEGRTFKSRKDPKKARPKPKDQENFTDPESRIMVNSDKAFIQGYNPQASVDALTHVIVAAKLTNQPADCEHLKEQIEQVKKTTGRRPKEVSADAGYCSEENLEYLEDEHIEAFIPPDKVKYSTWRSQRYPRGRIPKDADRK